jgi:hypothetical protein
MACPHPTLAGYPRLCAYLTELRAEGLSIKEVQHLTAAEAAQVVLREQAGHTAHLRDIARELLARGYSGIPGTRGGTADLGRRQAVLEARLGQALEDDAFLEVAEGVFRLAGSAGEANDGLADVPLGSRGQPTHHEVRRRRLELGLSTGALAYRAGQDWRVLEYLEGGLMVMGWHTADRLRVALRREGWA